LGGAGRVDEALAIVNDEIASTGAARFHLAELYRIRGDLLLLNGGKMAGSEAKSCWLRAIEIARQQQAPSFELRAATSLCRYQLREGGGTEGWQLLKRVYSSFTEGLDTHDLEEARALLESSFRLSSVKTRSS
jgi:predicted ATPase